MIVKQLVRSRSPVKSKTSRQRYVNLRLRIAMNEMPDEDTESCLRCQAKKEQSTVCEKSDENWEGTVLEANLLSAADNDSHNTEACEEEEANNTIEEKEIRKKLRRAAWEHSEEIWERIACSV